MNQRHIDTPVVVPNNHVSIKQFVDCCSELAVTRAMLECDVYTAVVTVIHTLGLSIEGVPDK